MPEFVRLEPHVIDEIVAICNTTLTELHQALKTTDRLQLAEGFGDFESAQQLAAGYALRPIRALSSHPHLRLLL